MKIAIPTSGDNVNDKIDVRFGRAKSFLVYDTETKTSNIVGNKQQANSAQGAGIQSAVNVISGGADILLCCHCGPKAMDVLNKKGVEVYMSKEEVMINAIKNFEEGSLKRIYDADVEGHWV